MRILVLGGTRFVGYWMVKAALARGHQITLFNRGKYRPDAFPEVETILGNRDGELARLDGRRWDAVLDVCGWIPRHVQDSVLALRDRVPHYTYISTVSVYADFSPRPMHEEQPLGRLEDEGVEVVDNHTYGPLKALCERKAEEAMPGRVLHIRPGLVVGPEDYTDRLTYWPRRLAAGGEVVVPGSGEEPVQFIDARDLAEFTLDMTERQVVGAFNCTGPDWRLTMRQFLSACAETTASTAQLLWIQEEFLAQEAPPTGWPLWTPSARRGIYMIDCGKAQAAGLRYRPLAETLGDLLAWDAGRPVEKKQNAGPDPEAEAALLTAWRGAQPRPPA